MMERAEIVGLTVLLLLIASIVALALTLTYKGGQAKAKMISGVYNIELTAWEASHITLELNGESE